ITNIACIVLLMRYRLKQFTASTGTAVKIFLTCYIACPPGRGMFPLTFLKALCCAQGTLEPTPGQHTHNFSLWCP
ncbi:MAG TPA: hypothetical protein VLH18_05130, partial [Candidatus Limnocylindrales bacterium]|nr:hypothetical protein [Candidatus Limnocylindrales bacterium]